MCVCDPVISPVAHHLWLLSDAVDILPFLLLPLAGPEELTEEENDGETLKGLWFSFQDPFALLSYNTVFS